MTTLGSCAVAEDQTRLACIDEAEPGFMSRNFLIWAFIQTGHVAGCNIQMSAGHTLSIPPQGFCELSSHTLRSRQNDSLPLSMASPEGRLEPSDR